jgi:hypothetical protein
MKQKKLEIHGILLGKISRLCSMSHKINKVYLLCEHMKYGLRVIAIRAVANYGNFQYYLWRHDHSSNSGPCQLIIMTEDKLQNISPGCCNQHQENSVSKCLHCKSFCCLTTSKKTYRICSFLIKNPLKTKSLMTDIAFCFNFFLCRRCLQVIMMKTVVLLNPP